MFTSDIVIKWFIVFFAFLSLACFRWGIREVRRDGNKTILRTCMILFAVFAAIAILMIVSYHNDRYSGYNPQQVTGGMF
jgi:heme A synthase